MKKLSFLLLIFLLIINNLKAENKTVEVGLDEQLGKFIPLELSFTDETGNMIPLKKLVNKPTIFLLVYYECPGLCDPLMSEVVSRINQLDLIPGKDYQVISISINEEDNYQIASNKKKNYLKAIKVEFPDSAWRFLTGSYDNIHKIADAFGYHFKKQGEIFVHPTTVMFVSPNGKITRYLIGTEFLPFDMKMAILESSKGIPMPTIATLMKICFNYDPQGGKYLLNVTRIAGVTMILTAAIFIIFLTRKPKKKNLN